MKKYIIIGLAIIMSVGAPYFVMMKVKQNNISNQEIVNKDEKQTSAGVLDLGKPKLNDKINQVIEENKIIPFIPEPEKITRDIIEPKSYESKKNNIDKSFVSNNEYSKDTIDTFISVIPRVMEISRRYNKKISQAVASSTIKIEEYNNIKREMAHEIQVIINNTPGIDLETYIKLSTKLVSDVSFEEMVAARLKQNE